MRLAVGRNPCLPRRCAAHGGSRTGRPDLLKKLKLAVAREDLHNGSMPERLVMTFCRIVCAATLVALLSGAATAQIPLPGIDISPGRSSRPLTPEEKEKQQALDERYKATLEAIPDKKAPTDPWGNLRSAPASKK